NNYRGKWLTHEPISITEYRDEVMKRLNAIQDLVRQTYPQPMGADVSWVGGFTKTSFADEVKFVPVKDRDPEETKTKINPVYRYNYTCGLAPWVCTGNPHEIMNMYPEGSSGYIDINANDLAILNEIYEAGDEWRIDGRPIKRKLFAAGQWKGYDMMSSVGGYYADPASDHFVLMSRDGMLPYIPITRKQFLDRAVPYVARSYDELAKKLVEGNDAMPS